MYRRFVIFCHTVTSIEIQPMETIDTLSSKNFGISTPGNIDVEYFSLKPYCLPYIPGKLQCTHC